MVYRPQWISHLVEGWQSEKCSFKVHIQNISVTRSREFGALPIRRYTRPAPRFRRPSQRASSSTERSRFTENVHGTIK